MNYEKQAKRLRKIADKIERLGEERPQPLPEWAQDVERWAMMCWEAGEAFDYAFVYVSEFGVTTVIPGRDVNIEEACEFLRERARR